MQAKSLLLFGLMFCLSQKIAFADSFEAYFNHNQNRSYIDPYYNRNRIGDNLEDVILEVINKASNY